MYILQLAALCARACSNFGGLRFIPFRHTSLFVSGKTAILRPRTERALMWWCGRKRPKQALSGCARPSTDSSFTHRDFLRILEPHTLYSFVAILALHLLPRALLANGCRGKRCITYGLRVLQIITATVTRCGSSSRAATPSSPPAISSSCLTLTHAAHANFAPPFASARV